MPSLKEHFAQLIAQQSEPKKAAWGGTAVQNNNSNLTSEVVNTILTHAVMSRCSDIHIEPRHGNVLIRFRIDGVLYDVLDIKESNTINIIPRVKILANIPTDSASSRKAWDGRFSSDIGGQKFDFRVATFPTILGDKIAIRLLNKSASTVDLKKIGLRPSDQERLERIIQRKSGLMLVTGPTGGGKTTTLYSILRRLHTPSVNIVTLEDPVEYQIDGINQCDLKNKSTDSDDFISGLKAILRQDPDIILIGEIRDHESAEIALRASITGHLVFSSLHANGAIGTIMRLINMGIEPHIVAYALIGALAQRLVRRICDNCKVPHTLDIAALTRMCDSCGIDPALFIIPQKPKSSADEIHYLHSSSPTSAQEFTFYKGKGCDLCSHTGFKGRVGIFEVVHMNDAMREVIIKNASIEEIEKIAMADGFQPMAIDAIQKVKAGLVTIDDIYSILLEKSS